MNTLQKILVVVAMQIAIIGIIVGLATIWFVWSYNTPVTDSLSRVVAGAQRVLEATDNGLNVVNSGMRTALAAVSTIDGATRSAGERIVETNLAFVILERTIGDRLFPRVVAAQETISAVAGTVIGINDTLEAANRLPFLEVPTMTTQLETVNDRLTSARQQVEEMQAGIRAIKEEKVSRPVSFITDRTEPLIDNLDNAITTIQTVQSRITVTLARLETIARNLSRIIDLISIVTTLIMLWLIGVQAYVITRAYERLSGRRIRWERLWERENPPAPSVG